MVVAQQAKIEHLTLIIAKLLRIQFGQISEKIDEMVGQLELALENLKPARRNGQTARSGMKDEAPKKRGPYKNKNSN